MRSKCCRHGYTSLLVYFVLLGNKVESLVAGCPTAAKHDGTKEIETEGLPKGMFHYELSLNFLLVILEHLFHHFQITEVE